MGHIWRHRLDMARSLTGHLLRLVPFTGRPVRPAWQAGSLVWSEVAVVAELVRASGRCPVRPYGIGCCALARGRAATDWWNPRR